MCHGEVIYDIYCEEIVLQKIKNGNYVCYKNNILI